MKNGILAKTSMDSSIEELVRKVDHRTLAIWAADCAERTLHYFEDEWPKDHRPRQAIDALHAWVRTGEFRMADVRRVALEAHAAAREVKGHGAARSAARAAGQALATAHVPRHAIAAAIYAATAVRDSSDLSKAEDALYKEREWQFKRLMGLIGDVIS